ncbi:hypothetical protein [Yoonia sp. BS5-3]|uniref:Uncharacterized protein n=1 Tax=Yoonia phaeophyticola TaxID=3137369 RepID=A0ABZ2V8H0_9RHOB
MSSVFSFSKDDDVTILRDGEVIYPAASSLFAREGVALTEDSFEKFGQTWKRNASDYENAIADLGADGLRFILREGDMRSGSDASKLRERAEISGSGFASDLAGTTDFDFTICVRAYDNASTWSSLVQILTDDSDPDLSYQPLVKMQTRPAEAHITLNTYLPAFAEIARIPLLPLNEPHRMRITVNFETGYIRWAVNGETIVSTKVAGMDIAGQSDAGIYPKLGAYREGPVTETAVTDFNAVSFVSRS